MDFDDIFNSYRSVLNSLVGINIVKLESQRVPLCTSSELFAPEVYETYIPVNLTDSITIEVYESKEDAEEGHFKWVQRAKENKKIVFQDPETKALRIIT